MQNTQEIPMNLKLVGNSNIQPISEYLPDQVLAELEKNNAQILMEWEVGKDIEPIKTAKRQLVSLRTGIKPLKDGHNKYHYDEIEKVNGEAKRLTAAVEKLEAPLEDIIEAEKARAEAIKQAKIKAEQERVAAIQNKIAIIRELPLKCVNKSAEYIHETMEYFNQVTSETFDYEELTSEASTVKSDTFTKLQGMHAERVLFEKQQADAAAAAETLKAFQEAETKRQAQEAETRRIAQKAEDDRLIEERRIFAEEQRKIRLENEAKQAAIDEERRKQEAELKAQQDALAEQQRKIDEEKEQIRLEKEAEEKRKADESARLEREEQEKQIKESLLPENMRVPPEARITFFGASNEEEKINTPLTLENINHLLRTAIETTITKLRDLGYEAEPEEGQIIADLREVLKFTKGE